MVHQKLNLARSLTSFQFVLEFVNVKLAKSVDLGQIYLPPAILQHSDECERMLDGTLTLSVFCFQSNSKLGSLKLGFKLSIVCDQSNLPPAILQHPNLMLENRQSSCWSSPIFSPNMSKISKLDKSTSRQLYLGMNEFTHGEAYFASGTFFMHKFKLGLGALLAKSTKQNRSLKTDNHLSAFTFHSGIVSRQERDESFNLSLNLE